MKTNVGSIDKIIRYLIAAVALGLILTHTVVGTAAIIVGIVGGVMLITALLGFCGLYKVLGCNTCPMKK